MDNLKIQIDEKSNKIFCLKRRRWIKLTEKEVTKQEYIKTLIDKYKYEINQLNVEVKVKMGSSYAKKKADIVVYKNTGKEKPPKVIVETKKINWKDGLHSLRSYMNAIL
jgi:type I restriction enzyme M protein